MTTPMLVDDNNRQIILASGSPRRRELLTHLGFEPCVIVSDVPEQPAPGEDGTAYTRRLAESKAHAVATNISADHALPRWILAADTVVTLRGRILEKPADAAHAVQMLQDLSGTTHEVITSFCWLDRAGEACAVRTVVTEVEFLQLDQASIERYVATGEPMDKAGAYGAQGVAGVFVSAIRGSYTCVVGLPVTEVVATLRELGALAAFPFARRAP
jgi:septum formation protein